MYQAVRTSLIATMFSRSSAINLERLRNSRRGWSLTATLNDMALISTAYFQPWCVCPLCVSFSPSPLLMTTILTLWTSVRLTCLLISTRRFICASPQGCRQGMLTDNQLCSSSTSPYTDSSRLVASGTNYSLRSSSSSILSNLQSMYACSRSWLERVSSGSFAGSMTLSSSTTPISCDRSSWLPSRPDSLSTIVESYPGSWASRCGGTGSSARCPYPRPSSLRICSSAGPTLLPILGRILHPWMTRSNFQLISAPSTGHLSGMLWPTDALITWPLWVVYFGLQTLPISIWLLLPLSLRVLCPTLHQSTSMRLYVSSSTSAITLGISSTPRRPIDRSRSTSTPTGPPSTRLEARSFFSTVRSSRGSRSCRSLLASPLLRLSSSPRSWPSRMGFFTASCSRTWVFPLMGPPPCTPTPRAVLPFPSTRWRSSSSSTFCATPRACAIMLLTLCLRSSTFQASSTWRISLPKRRQWLCSSSSWRRLRPTAGRCSVWSNDYACACTMGRWIGATA
mmetsp:Transcript_47108/g.123615  ORF Transcript_47108/g.123615 Transcript_47108/m.123615 type:complete len:509 (-) Transcript_47108:226-1752(-)